MEISRLYQFSTVLGTFIILYACNGNQASADRRAEPIELESRIQNAGDPFEKLDEAMEKAEDKNRFEYFRNQDNYLTSTNYALALKMGQFFGNDFEGYDIPFLGRSLGVAAITIDNVRHVINTPEDIYFRQTIKLPMGYNRIYFSVELTDGRIFENIYLDATIERVPNTLDVDITN